METNEQQPREAEARSVNLGRHQAQCTICSSSYRQEIEEEWINWGNTTLIAERYGVTRDAIYRHAHALDLFRKRQRNIKMALERIIERLDIAPTSGSVVLSAIKHYEELTQREQGEQVEGLTPKELFDGMSKDEREAFARDGSLPDWFSRPKGATAVDGREGEQETQAAETKRVQ